MENARRSKNDIGKHSLVLGILTGRHKIKISIQKSKSTIYTCKMQILVLIGLQNCPLCNIIYGKEFLYKFAVCVTSEFRISVSCVCYGQKPGDCWPRVKIAVPDELSAIHIRLFTDFRDMLLLISVFSCVWHFAALSVNMLCGEVTRKV